MRRPLFHNNRMYCPFKVFNTCQQYTGCSVAQTVVSVSAMLFLSFRSGATVSLKCSMLMGRCLYTESLSEEKLDEARYAPLPLSPAPTMVKHAVGCVKTTWP